MSPKCPLERPPSGGALTQDPGWAEGDRREGNRCFGLKEASADSWSLPSPLYPGFQKEELPASSLKNKQMYHKWQLLNPAIIVCPVQRPFPEEPSERAPGDSAPPLGSVDQLSLSATAPLLQSVYNYKPVLRVQPGRRLRFPDSRTAAWFRSLVCHLLLCVLRLIPSPLCVSGSVPTQQ